MTQNDMHSIIKTLEGCIGESPDCLHCNYLTTLNCRRAVMADALRLIRELLRRIS